MFTVLGNKFNLGEFHYEVLRYSTVPLDVLEQIINDWIAEKQASEGSATTQKPKDYQVNSANKPSFSEISLMTKCLMVIYIVHSIAGKYLDCN